MPITAHASAFWTSFSILDQLKGLGGLQGKPQVEYIADWAAII